jgi:hypothetical protein
MTATVARPIPRFALTKPEAAASLGMGLTFFEKNVYPHLRVKRCEGKVLVPVSELERWAEEDTERVFDVTRSSKERRSS